MSMKIIHQRDWKDCGVCCLASIIEYYKGYVSLEQLRLDACVTNEGTTALNLILASKKYGFDAVGVSMDDLDNIKTLPAIAHMKLSNGMMHYVVIYKIGKDKVLLMDPAKGKVIKKREEFLQEWSKVVLLFYPRGRISVLKKENTLFQIFGKILISEKKLVTLIVIVSILLTLFTILGGYYFQVMGNAINENYDFLYLKILAFAFGIMVIIKIALSYLRTYLENHLNKNIDCLLNIDFLKHLYNLPLNVLTSRTSGEIVTRVSELANIKSLITDLFITSTLDFFLMLVAMPLLINISSKLFLILLLALLLYLLIGIISSKMIYKKAYRNIEYEADFNNTIIEDMNMINSIKNLSATDNRMKRLEYSLTKYLYDSFLLGDFLNKERNLKNIVSEISFFLINTWGFYLVLNNDLNIVSLVTFNTLLGFFFDPLKNIIDSLPKYNFLKATITKINDFLSVNPEKYGLSEKIVNNQIEIKNLNFTYNQVDYIIKNFSMKIMPGEMVLLNGSSGSGKSTICKILDRYINNYEGEVLIGDINIKDLSIATVRNNVLYVNQQEAIFSGTIKDNITLENPFDENKFQQICKVCKVDEVVNNKVLRYETFISNDATNISGGEKERIILARALMKEFNILILDEALSEVDSKTERAIINNIRNYFQGKTIIYITHKKQKNLFDKIIRIGKQNELSRTT